MLFLKARLTFSTLVYVEKKVSSCEESFSTPAKVVSLMVLR